jgi:hypothetical protein
VGLQLCELQVRAHVARGLRRMSVNIRHEVALLCSTCICLQCSASFSMCPCKMYAIIHCSTICHIECQNGVFQHHHEGKSKEILATSSTVKWPIYIALELWSASWTLVAALSVCWCVKLHSQKPRLPAACAFLLS